MASTTLYPPNVPSYVPAFVYNEACMLTFTLSDINMYVGDVQGIHISIIKQSTGKSVVNKSFNISPEVYCATGIVILNISLEDWPSEYITYDSQGNKVYTLPLSGEFVTTGDDIGWGLGWIYKIQIRFSDLAYDESIGQSAWLNQNANHFSEWSTFCITKAIGYPRWSSFLNNIDYLSSSTLNFIADYSNDDSSEILYSYKLQLWKDEWKDDEEGNSIFDNCYLLEESEEIYTNQYYNPNQIQYNFKTKLENTYFDDEELGNMEYFLIIGYTTLNKYSHSLLSFPLNTAIPYEDSIEKYNYPEGQWWIDVQYSQDAQTPVQVITADIIDTVGNSSFKSDFNNQTFIAQEEEEGRIGLKLYLNDDTPQTDIFIITRADSKDNFQTWTDIKWIFCNDTIINQLPMIFDYTIESGVWYKYSVQTYKYNEEAGMHIRGIMNTMALPVLREFEFAYLIGEGGRQLKLQYNNNMNSYVYNYSDSKTDTIGGKYPFITRNGNMKYRTIPINGLISFNMDEQELFTNDTELYIYPDIITRYQNRHQQYRDYDYIKERDFREKVLAFLQDGKPKLFKSTSEGNLIIRLMQVAAQPNQSLNRMIFSFTSTGHEVADATMENYLKYKFYSTGEDDITLSPQTSEIPAEPDPGQIIEP